MPSLHDIFAGQVDRLRAERDEILASSGTSTISSVSVAQAYGGLRDVGALVCDTSVVDPERGLIIRGIPVLELLDHYPEDIFFLLLIGRLPDEAEALAVREEIAAQERVPEYVWQVLDEMPADSHPMSMLSAGLLALESHSVMTKRFDEGLAREDYWRATLTDALRVLGSLPTLAGGVYRMRYRKGPRFAHDPLLDWSQDFCAMCGVRKPAFYEAMRRAAILQSDHEGGNVCAFTCHTVGSVLSNAYLAVSAGFNGLAGPLHGRAAQQSTQWVLGAVTRHRGTPTDAQVEEYAWETLKSGRVIPGFGHAVLRGQDPRFTAMLEFGKAHFGADPVFATVEKMSRIVPEVLKQQGKARNPYPNVDFGMGAVWHHFGITELDYYTVPFAISLAMGMLAQLVINRALVSPIVRPRSVTTDWLRSRTQEVRS
ncbi:MAG TPA: citrate (Si)-synthase [Candidatus Krumholzibacteria bacterium]|nr:citrate (Si)-synthase [Candidatus Krumholzibacteria bacterium]